MSLYECNFIKAIWFSHYLSYIYAILSLSQGFYEYLSELGRNKKSGVKNLNFFKFGM